MSTPPATLRERRRADLVAEVTAVARRHLAEQGAAALSLRAVARDVGIAVSALYRYFASRDELLTALVVEAFDAQADAVEQAVRSARRADPDDLRGQLLAAFRAYRRWSGEHPAEFGLCYGSPVPGYAAPPERTVRAGTRAPEAFLEVVARAVAAERLDPDAVQERADALTEGTARQLAALRERRGYALPLPVLAATMDAFVRVHGCVVMEVFGQLRPVVPDAAPFFEETLADCLRAVGLGR